MPWGGINSICQAKAEWMGSIDKESKDENWFTIWGGRKTDSSSKALAWF